MTLFKHHLGTVVRELDITPLEIEIMISLNDHLAYEVATHVWDYMIDDASKAYLECYAIVKSHAMSIAHTWPVVEPTR